MTASPKNNKKSDSCMQEKKMAIFTNNMAEIAIFTPRI